jgi:transposase-like protein
VINVDRNPSYPKAVADLRQSGELGRRCQCRPVRYLNNIIEQDHGSNVRRTVDGKAADQNFTNPL